MTEKVAKKIGEAYAFAQVLTDTFTSNEDVMSELFGDHADAILDIAKAQREELADIADEFGMSEIVLPKAEKTGAKLTKMGEMYVGDDWDDVAEVLEWMSLFVGGAIVHWQLIVGSAEEMDHTHFGNIAGVGTEYYAKLMEQLREYSKVIGKARAQA
ncbi:MAG: hypothetical protein MRY57_00600 [Candidatus Pacebacteria bacterium]|nr:hypothetical protein [Candidatus Paceibacterota bacterium]